MFTFFYWERFAFQISHDLDPQTLCRDVTNSWLDDKLPLAGLWLFLVEVTLSKERIQNYFLLYFKENET